MSEIPTSPPPTRELAAYMAAAPREPLPAEVQEKTKHHLLDTLAAMVSGQPLLPGRKAIAYARNRAGPEEASAVGTGYLTTVENAALATECWRTQTKPMTPTPPRRRTPAVASSPPR